MSLPGHIAKMVVRDAALELGPDVEKRLVDRIAKAIQCDRDEQQRRALRAGKEPPMERPACPICSRPFQDDAAVNEHFRIKHPASVYRKILKAESEATRTLKLYRKAVSATQRALAKSDDPRIDRARKWLEDVLAKDSAVSSVEPKDSG